MCGINCMIDLDGDKPANKKVKTASDRCSGKATKSKVVAKRSSSKYPLKVTTLKNRDTSPKSIVVPYDIDDFSFRYINRPAMKNNHSGVIIIAMKRHEGHDMDGVKYKKRTFKVDYGVAYCSPDDVYDKAYGKDKAIRKSMGSFNSVVPRKMIAKEINDAILFDILSDANSYPVWAKEHLDMLLRNNVLNDIIQNVIPNMTFVDPLAHMYGKGGIHHSVQHPKNACGELKMPTMFNALFGNGGKK